MSDYEPLPLPPEVNSSRPSKGDFPMRIIQICSARIAQHTEEPTILGLSEDGSVYAYREEQKPIVTTEQVMVPACELTEEQKQYAQPVNNTPPIPQPTPFENKGGIFRSKPAPKVTTPTEITHYVIWKEVFKDGWNAGWYPLSMNISKPIPHKDDPTRYERA
jgi:hypothetical protein